MTVCPYDKGTLPRGPRGRKRATVLGRGSWRRELLFEFATLGAVPHYIFAFCTCEEGMTFELFVLSLSKYFIYFSEGP